MKLKYTKKMGWAIVAFALVTVATVAAALVLGPALTYNAKAVDGVTLARVTNTQGLIDLPTDSIDIATGTKMGCRISYHETTDTNPNVPTQFNLKVTVTANFNIAVDSVSWEGYQSSNPNTYWTSLAWGTPSGSTIVGYCQYLLATSTTVFTEFTVTLNDAGSYSFTVEPVSSVPTSF
jgi:hypothetical protein